MTSPKAAESFTLRALRTFGDIRAHEVSMALLMSANLCVVLLAYYVVKAAREPLVLATGGAELKSYAAGAQAVVLMAVVPAYGWLASRMEVHTLIRRVTLGSVLCLWLFYAGYLLRMPMLGVVFFVWVGIFSLAIISQFWSYANDIYDRAAGERLFPIIAIGSNVGSMLGAFVAARFYALGATPGQLLLLASVLLLVHLGLYVASERQRTKHGMARRETPSAGEDAVLKGPGGFRLIANSRWLWPTAAVLVMLNLVNTLGEFVLSDAVLTQATQALEQAPPGTDPRAFRETFVGAFYAQFFLWVNVAGIALQALAVSRLVKLGGLAAVWLALPLVSLGVYSLATVGVGFVLFRWLKTLENATDYSVMNTAKAMIWLPASREQKYKAKQAIDTFFVRFGDVLAALTVYLGSAVLGLGARGFALTAVAGVFVWLGFVAQLLRAHRQTFGRTQPRAEPASH